MGEQLANLYGTIASLRQILLWSSVVGLALAVVGGWLLADRALRPVDRITAAAASIADGDGTASSLGTRLDVPDTGDELARLSGTFNAMLDRLQAAFVAQQRFVADASHELRTPLTAIRGNLDVLARQVAALRAANGLSGDLDAAVADMKRESARMGRLLEDLLLLARSDAPEGVSLNARPVRLDDVARAAVRTAAPLAAGQVLEVDAPEAVTVSGDPDRLLQLLLILLENALRHTPTGSRVAVEIAPPADGEVHVAIRDEGEGIAPEHLPHLFERFYRADGARGRATGGTGLGLAIADTIVRAHGGRIGVESAPGQGSTFTVTLPTDPDSRDEHAIAGPIAQPARPPGAPLTQSSPRSPGP
ncbi:MAG: HAMP domain-containing histidine kinase [Chloroflexota bacterium]|nr:HAMP domain-containing histidine kinase [Chloroflexota bacterium]